jgi:exonuclease SbcC
LIIQKLVLRNFKSYGDEQKVDLTNIDAVGICGPNGAGKSSIIEAITFALYSKNTATERREIRNEGIIRDNEDEAFISLSFEKDDQTYTVERSARRKGTGTATLSENGKTLQAGADAVTKLVEKIVGMDYETFVSSTIIRQDEMDKITDLRPGERKEILSKIFGLEFYETLKKNTHEKLGEAKGEVEAAQETMTYLEKQIADEPKLEKEQAAAKRTASKMQIALTETKEMLSNLEKEIKIALKKKSDYDVKRTELDSVIKDIKNISTEMPTINEEIETILNDQKELAALTQALANEPELEQALGKAKSEASQLTSTLSQNQKAIEAALKKKSKYDLKSAEIDNLIRNMKTTSSDLLTVEDEIKSIMVEQEQLAGFVKDLAQESELEETLDKAKKAKESLAATIAENTQKLKSIKETISEEETHYNTINTSQKAECPVCKRPLDEQHKQEVLKQYNSRLKELQSNYLQIQADTSTNHEKLEKEVKPSVRQLEKQVKELQTIKVAKAKLETSISRLPRLNETKNELKAKILKATEDKKTQETELATLSDATKEYEKLANKRKNIEKTLEETSEHVQELEAKIKELHKTKLTKTKLETSISRLPTLQKTKNDLKAKMLKATTTKTKLGQELAELTETVKEYERLDEKRRSANDTLTEISGQKADAEATIKHLDDQLDQMTKSKTELNHLKLKLGTKLETIPIYKILEDAFGKDGIPTAMLKDLVPEVEEEASRILRDLSNGRMNINFRFGRETRAGGRTEELIIEAEDETGLHPVTRFSGGERMRINLALRLGISEVIARRSGYKGKIETLIIDEGLSALDEEGRQATIDILRRLRERFKKIMVISHVEDVKDAFDTKIVISKNAAGHSIAEVI